VNIAAAGQSLADIFGRVTINDGSFSDRVAIHDQQTGANVDFFDSYTATMRDNQLALSVGARTTLGGGQVISRSFNRTIDFNGVDSVDFRAATRTAAALSAGIELQSVARFTETQVDVGGVADTRLGSAARTLNGILGRTTLTGGQEDSRVILDDQGQTAGRTYRIGASRITQPIQLGERDVNYGAFRGVVSVRAGSANDRFAVDGQRADGRIVSVDGNGGRDTVVGPNQDNSWLLIGNSFGTLNEQISFFETDNLVGQTRDDTFRFLPSGRIDGQINGAGGFDTLDYSQFTTGVTVNLSNGLATAVGLGALNVRNVFGGSASDTLTGNNLFNVLVGNGGIDVLEGGSGGRDVLIGGTGGDTLSKSGGGDTIYLGGDVAAADRNNVASMKAIMTEWLQPTTVQSRVANLAAGVGPGGGVRLGSEALDGDGVTDTFFGSLTPDAFYREAVDAFSGNFLPGAADRVILV
jgi:hypothetical protein